MIITSLSTETTTITTADITTVNMDTITIIMPTVIGITTGTMVTITTGIMTGTEVEVITGIMTETKVVVSTVITTETGLMSAGTTTALMTGVHSPSVITKRPLLPLNMSARLMLEVTISNMVNATMETTVAMVTVTATRVATAEAMVTGNKFSL